MPANVSLLIGDRMTKFIGGMIVLAAYFCVPWIMVVVVALCILAAI